MALRILGSAILGVACAFGALAQDKYPSKPAGASAS